MTDVGNPSGLTNEQYSYDKLGNRLTDSNTNTLFTTNTWTYNANNQLTQGYTRNGDPITPTWDENGSLARNRTPDPASAPLENQRYVYDASNRISEVQDKDGNPIASYQYDPFGRRIVKTTPGNNTTVYLYSDEGLMAEATASGSIATEYGWQPGNLWGTDPLYIKTTKTNGTSPEVFYYQNDHLGTPQKAVDTQGNIVWEMKAQAFGETTVAPSSTITSNLRFPGQYEDLETNAHYNYFRDYRPRAGRYDQEDPIALDGGINIYIYANGIPINHTDPIGLYDLMDFTGDALNFTAGLGNAVTFGGSTWVAKQFMNRDDADVLDKVKRCSGSFRVGEWTSLVLGGGRLLYAGSAKIGASLAADGAAAMVFRNNLKRIMRGPLAASNYRIKNYEDLMAKYGSDQAIKAAAGRTNPGFNALGANMAAGGATVMTSNSNCGCQ